MIEWWSPTDNTSRREKREAGGEEERQYSKRIMDKNYSELIQNMNSGLWT